MNPLSNVRNITKMNEKELELGVPEKASWHQIYKDSSWIFFGGVDSDLTEGDLICVFSQWGEVVNIHLVRDRITGRSKGFGFLAFYDQKSTILAVDNANGIKVCGRVMRVDHCENYQIPKNLNKLDSETRELIEKGCAPQPICIKKDDRVKSEDARKDVKKKEKQRIDSDEDDHSSKRSKGEELISKRPNEDHHHRRRDEMSIDLQKRCRADSELDDVDERRKRKNNEDNNRKKWKEDCEDDFERRKRKNSMEHDHRRRKDDSYFDESRRKRNVHPMQTNDYRREIPIRRDEHRPRI